MKLTSEIRKATDPIYQKISKILPEIEWTVHAPYIHKINKLKKEKNAIILAHNYQTPEIYHGIADVAADSLALAIEASKTNADLIIIGTSRKPNISKYLLGTTASYVIEHAKIPVLVVPLPI